VVTTWTLPQVLFSYIGIQEQNAADARQMFTLTMAAIGAVFSKRGSKIAERILASLDGPDATVEDLLDELSETEALVLFGKQKLEEMREKPDGTD
jgi:hypothetical protein